MALALRSRVGPCESCACTWGRLPSEKLMVGGGRGGVRRKGVRAQATKKQGQGAKVALVGKKLQLKRPAPQPEQKEAERQEEAESSRIAPQQESQEGGTSGAIAQPKEREGARERGTEQPAQAESGPQEPSGTASGKSSDRKQEEKQGTTTTLSAEEQAAEIQALRKVLQGAPTGEPARSSGAFYAGVLEEIGLINWPPLGQVAGTTALVMGMLVGAGAALTVLNYGLSEATKSFFEEGPVREAVRKSLGF